MAPSWTCAHLRASESLEKVAVLVEAPVPHFDAVDLLSILACAFFNGRHVSYLPACERDTGESKTLSVIEAVISWIEGVSQKCPKSVPETYCSSMPATLECHCRTCCDGLYNELLEA